MRGGTSRGAFLRARDLPDDPVTRDQVILAIYGSPDPRQINGLGGADPLTSKVAVIERCDRSYADVSYTFGQVAIDEPRVHWAGNCGNMSSAVGPFAVNTGLVAAREPTTQVRIYNTNTDRVLTASVPVRAGAAIEDGDFAIAGVPGTGARIDLDFGDCGGAVLGKVLPTGKPVDRFTLTDGTVVEASIVDATTPFVFVRAGEVGMLGTELPDQIRAEPGLLERLERIRSAAAIRCGIVSEGDDPTASSPSLPRISVVSPADDYSTHNGDVCAAEIDLVVRQMSMQRPHQTYAVTGTLCTAVASLVPGTVVNELRGAEPAARVKLGHPGGIIVADAAIEENDRDYYVRRAALSRTAATLMDGFAHVSDTAFASGQPT